MRTVRSMIALLLLSLVFTLSAAAQSEPLKVVATYSVLGDIVSAIGGDHIALTVLVGPDGDPHVYEPTPQDVAALAEADILFENGLGLEPWIDDLYAASGSRAVRVPVSEGIDVIPFMGHGHDHAHAGMAEGHGGFMEGEPMVATRLIVGDYEDRMVRVIDLRSGEVVGAFELTARPALYPAPNGRYAFAIQTDGNITQLIDSGVSAVAHDEHYHTDFGAPALLDVAIEGRTPIHYTPHHGQIAIFHDGDGAAAIFTLDGLFAGDVTTVTTARPHHGVAVPLGDVVLISSPDMQNPDARLPIGVDVMALDGAIRQSFPECPGLHGEAAYSENGVAFGCTDGVLLIERQGDTFVSRKIANPTANPDLRTGRLFVAEGAQYMLGNYGRNAIVRIDPAAGTSEIVIDAGMRIWSFAFHGDDPSKLVALTVDGNLHVIDIATGTIEGTVQVVDPFVPPASERPAARPSFLVNGHLAYVSDPLPGDIRIVDLETLEIQPERIVVGGKPSSMALFGLAAESEVGGEHDHAHEEAHAHEHGEFDPHTWMSPRNVIVMVEAIRSALSEADPAHADAYAANAAAYTAQLEELDAYIREQVATIPEEHRVLITTHELFGYFARDYGFELTDSALGAITTAEGDPSAAQIAAVIDEIRAVGAPAVFVENVGNPELMEQIAREAGVTLAPPLYTHGLGAAGSGAETYLDMMRYNIDVIAGALR